LEERTSFLKKKQKTFAPCGMSQPHAPAGQKFFAELFFKKATAYFFLVRFVEAAEPRLAP
jgi:hypothetical protein